MSTFLRSRVELASLLCCQYCFTSSANLSRWDANSSSSGQYAWVRAELGSLLEAAQHDVEISVFVTRSSGNAEAANAVPDEKPQAAFVASSASSSSG